MTEQPTVTLVGVIETDPSIRPESAALTIVDPSTGRRGRQSLVVAETLTFVLEAALLDPVSGSHCNWFLRCDDPQGLAAGLTSNTEVEVVGTLLTERVTRRGLDRTYLTLVLDRVVPLDHLPVA